MSEIAEAMGKAAAYLREHPEEATYTDSVARAVLEDGLRVRVTGDGEITTDMPGAVGGRGESPSPGWLFRSAVASCTTALIAMRAAQEGIAIGSLEVDVDSESNDYGILGLDETIPAGPLSMSVRVRISSEEADGPALEEIVRWGLDHCPVSDAVRRAVDVSLEVEKV